MLEEERARAASMPAQPGVKRLELSARGQRRQPNQLVRDGEQMAGRHQGGAHNASAIHVLKLWGWGHYKMRSTWPSSSSAGST